MKRVLVVLIAWAAAGAAAALNTSGFFEAPITRLSAPELDAFRTYVEKTLDDGTDGKTVEWKAPKTQFVSKITPHRTFTQQGKPCREATIESTARDLHQRGRYLFCKVSTGAWEFALPEARPAARK